MKMDGISPVGHVAVNPHAVKTVRGKKQQAARRGAVLLSFHQIVRIPFQKEIDLIKIVAMQGIGFHCLPGGAVAEADLLRIDMCIAHGLFSVFIFIRVHFLPPFCCSAVRSSDIKAVTVFPTSIPEKRLNFSLLHDRYICNKKVHICNGFLRADGL